MAKVKKPPKCPHFGVASYPNKATAMDAGVSNPKRCGRCRQWH